MTFAFRRAGVYLCLAAVAVGLAACGRPLLERRRATVETINPGVPGDRFKTIVSIAGGGDARTDLRISVNVRARLTRAGVTALPRSGRWETEHDAVSAICEQAGIDGVLVVQYNRLRLFDCTTQKLAYDILGHPEGGNEGALGLADRLIKYLQRKQSS